MNYVELFGFAVATLGLIGNWVVGKHNWGWLIGIAFQSMWVYYAVLISAPALAVQSVLFGLVAARNYWVGRGRPDID